MIELIEVMGSDLTVVNSARVSMSKFTTEFREKDAELIKYLAKNEHWTPFAHPQLSFRIKMPIAVARQWYRHTIGIVRNEVSRRYVKTEPEFSKISEFRLQAENVKQGSSNDIVENNDYWIARYEDHIKSSTIFYNELIGANICAEQARYVLPQSMMTEFIETGSLYAYLRIIELRTSPHAQREIAEYANLIAYYVQMYFPVSYSAFKEVWNEHSV